MELKCLNKIMYELSIELTGDSAPVYVDLLLQHIWTRAPLTIEATTTFFFHKVKATQN